MEELALDFNAMILNREESKKQLDAKFDDLKKYFINEESYKLHLNIFFLIDNAFLILLKLFVLNTTLKFKSKILTFMKILNKSKIKLIKSTLI